MEKVKYFKTIHGKKLPLPLFFPDATKAVVKTLDSVDIEKTRTPGILVNTYHLYRELGRRVVEKHGGIAKFMGWEGAVISDSGGFQVMSLAKASGKRGSITDEGVTFRPQGSKKITLTPEESIRFQMLLRPDMVVVLDDFTPPGASYKAAKETVRRTILWARHSKEAFVSCCAQEGLTKGNRPYILAVVQGGDYLDLRKECAEKLAKIGFDGFGYGGWPITAEGNFNYEVAKVVADNAPRNYFLYGLGIGKPDEIVGCTDLGYHIFDCVLPTRDARHKRLYVYEADSIENIDIRQPKFYSFFTPDKEKYYQDERPVSAACDCLLCKNYSRAYLAHLFRIGDFTAGRLATIHNLRFYSILMERLQKHKKS
ncbi:MAG: queuine tRNA-ribosyltransferase family protein [Candidatus Cloacimonetes bacterium]|nr:queuine tRNA-ribosyltransferase family protein [Candidatus Cloacimonadota bacterium]